MTFRELLIPSADAIRSGASYSRRFAAESAVVPFGLIVGHEGKLSREDPPLTRECQVAAFHFRERDVFPPADLPDVFTEASAPRAFALGGSSRRLADVYQLPLEVERVD